MKTIRLTLPTLALAALGFALLPAHASAQTATETTSTLTFPVTHTFSGNFKSTDGNSGTFVNTVTTNSATSKHDVVVFTRSSDSETKTDTTDTTTNADGSRTVAYSSLDYGATTPFTSNKTITKEKHGQFVGTGTYTTAAGVSGDLTTLESKADIVDVVSAVYNSSSTGITNALHLEEDGFGFVTVKTLDLAPGGKLTVVVTTRYITSSK